MTLADTQAKRWYAPNAGNDFQGMVVDEDTGRTVAVTYDSKDAPFIAAACNHINQLRDLMQAFSEQVFADESMSIARPWAARFREALIDSHEVEESQS